MTIITGCSPTYNLIFSIISDGGFKSQASVPLIPLQVVTVQTCQSLYTHAVLLKPSELKFKL